MSQPKLWKQFTTLMISQLYQLIQYLYMLMLLLLLLNDTIVVDVVILLSFYHMLLFLILCLFNMS